MQLSLDSCIAELFVNEVVNDFCFFFRLDRQSTVFRLLCLPTEDSRTCEMPYTGL